jgi:hypothetical protein
MQTSTYGEILIYQKEELIRNYLSVIDHFKYIFNEKKVYIYGY